MKILRYIQQMKWLNRFIESKLLVPFLWLFTPIGAVTFLWTGGLIADHLGYWTGAWDYTLTWPKSFGIYLLAGFMFYLILAGVVAIGWFLFHVFPDICGDWADSIRSHQKKIVDKPIPWKNPYLPDELVKEPEQCNVPMPKFGEK